MDMTIWTPHQGRIFGGVITRTLVSLEELYIFGRTVYNVDASGACVWRSDMSNISFLGRILILGEDLMKGSVNYIGSRER